MPSASEHHQIPAETQRHDDDQAQETVQDLSAAAMLAQEQADDLDAILDDIETVLETNAEEYVNSFVQKGGE
ncbi:Prokaryotic ubiquitin-like protein Pup (Bacterial ubiquitin-like modifier) [Bifidobacterium animalis subsp. animalis]|uniref:ubiquitin-like protein Pup n=1 Tax=Bifidobacterium animalis TaxID=28025 RepID=UPI001020905D|nr:ubiquitin-like protein Pup [Bifidobacterium animalis]RYN13644.1 Prokaryotic ubiquitin-like protein Pup (Bacterial ubiquitin-like modifier) [Bifidobacterium animalis subsp. animalis]RYN14503.1 Prokaryotic ubiquitin-like protein Pup (Bacterial ubiquitin-like modifier) [Bifidobacterium animalis subsp. animalis]